MQHIHMYGAVVSLVTYSLIYPFAYRFIVYKLKSHTVYDLFIMMQLLTLHITLYTIMGFLVSLASIPLVAIYFTLAKVLKDFRARHMAHVAFVETQLALAVIGLLT